MDLTGKLPAELKSDIPQPAWDTVTFADGKGGQGVYGVPFLQESQVIIANKKLLDAAKVRIPTPEAPGPGTSTPRSARSSPRTASSGWPGR
ncbi:hypothetical protein ACFQX6_07510 [Streptosporangium lutulentum]